MREPEVRARLEKSLGPISEAEWLDIEDQGYVREYDNGELTWFDLRGVVGETLHRLRRHVENTKREQRGEVLRETESSERVSEPDRKPDISGILSDRTAARIGALNALDQLRLGPTAWGQVVREISSRVRPQVDSEALPQWVIELEIEAWVPAEDVHSIYQHVQRDLFAKTAPPRTTARTFRVAQFVWEEELRNPHELRKLRSDKRLWPALMERWNERNPHEQFDGWRAFRICCKRGKKATPPRYAHSNDYIASEAREYMAGEVRRLRQRLRFLPE